VGGWLARARRLLDEGGHGCVERGWLLYPVALRCYALLGGRVADTLGRRRTFLAGLGLFTSHRWPPAWPKPGRPWSPPAPAKASARRCCRRGADDHHHCPSTPAVDRDLAG
jgi:hypothetical protein